MSLSPRFQVPHISQNQVQIFWLCPPLVLSSPTSTHTSLPSTHPAPHIFKTLIWNYLQFLKIHQAASGIQAFARIVPSSRKTLSPPARHLRLTHSSKFSSSITSSKKPFLSFLIQFAPPHQLLSQPWYLHHGFDTIYWNRRSLRLSLSPLCMILSCSALLGLNTKSNLAKSILNE